MSAQVINLGSINIDHVYTVPHITAPGETIASSSFSTGLGGKGANQSVALARAGVQVAHVGQMAKADQWAVNELADSGVDVDSIFLTDGASGHAIIQVDEHGENAIVLHGGANLSVSAKLLETALSTHSKAQYLVLQNECNLLSEAFELARDRDIKLVLNPAPMTERIKQLPLSELDTLIVNQVEAQMLSQESDLEAIIAHCHDQWPCVRVLITLGAQGAVLLSNQQRIEISAESVSVVDTTAAGDTFVGFFIAAMVEGMSDKYALKFASKAAGLTVSRAGAQASIPQRKELV